MTLNVVRQQWNRVVFMQTNREDVGQRYLEIEVPVPPIVKKRKRYQTLSDDTSRRLHERGNCYEPISEPVMATTSLYLALKIQIV